jgi:hypothetical protein
VPLSRFCSTSAYVELPQFGENQITMTGAVSQGQLETDQTIIVRKMRFEPPQLLPRHVGAIFDTSLHLYCHDGSMFPHSIRLRKADAVSVTSAFFQAFLN